jgi:hypothetical protein
MVELELFHQDNTARPYEPVYVEVVARFEDYELQSYAADFDGQIFIEKIASKPADVPETCSASGIVDIRLSVSPV